jgi:glyceraldehyde-3-phosphate dehydrogenase/erythrose-4-phosphate dehydrogenase
MASQFTVVANRDPLKLPWAEMGIDIVIEVIGISAFLDELF